MMALTPLTVIVADDERPARRFLANLLKQCSGVAVVGEAGSGREALELIRATHPQLALLDLQMPEMGGLEVARQLSNGSLPFVAFVTAFDEHAIEAFELNAIDYLLKPVQRSRLDATLTRTRDRLGDPEFPRDRRGAIVRAAAAYGRRRRTVR